MYNLHALTGCEWVCWASSFISSESTLIHVSPSNLSLHSLLSYRTVHVSGQFLAAEGCMCVGTWSLLQKKPFIPNCRLFEADAWVSRVPCPSWGVMPQGWEVFPLIPALSRGPSSAPITVKSLLQVLRRPPFVCYPQSSLSARLVVPSWIFAPPLGHLRDVHEPLTSEILILILYGIKFILCLALFVCIKELFDAYIYIYMSVFVLFCWTFPPSRCGPKSGPSGILPKFQMADPSVRSGGLVRFCHKQAQRQEAGLFLKEQRDKKRWSLQLELSVEF